MRKIIVIYILICSCSQKYIYDTSIHRIRGKITQLHKRTINNINELQINDYKNHEKFDTKEVLSEILRLKKKWQKIQRIESDMECKAEYILDVGNRLNIIEKRLKLHNPDVTKPEETWDLLSLISDQLKGCDNILQDKLEAYKECE